MTLHINYKKIIAREILIFFSAVILILLIWGIFLLRNSYYKFQEEENKDKLTSLTSELDSLPRDEIKALYDGINQDFVVKYKIGNQEYAIHKKNEKGFLFDEYGIKKKVDSLPVSSLAYSKNPDPLQILNSDSTLVFDYIDLEKFRQRIKDAEYRQKLYETFSKDYDLGSISSFDLKIQEGIRYTPDIESRHLNLSNEKQLTQKKLNESKVKQLSNDNIYKILIWASLIVGLIVYLLRIIYISIKWSLRTLK